MTYNLGVFVRFLGEPEEDHDHGNDHENELEHGPERILTKIQGVSHGGRVQVPATIESLPNEDFHNMDHFIGLLEDHAHSFIEGLLEALSEDEEMSSMMFAITTPAENDLVAGMTVTVSATGAPTPVVHFAHRPANGPGPEFEYLGAAANRSAARYVWDTSYDMDGDYELAAMYTEDGAESAISDTIPVSVDNAASAETLDILENDGRKTQMLSMNVRNEIVTADGVMLTLPAGALASDDRITITVVDPPDAETAPGEAVGIGVNIVLASGQTTFGGPVTISLPYPEGKPDGLVDGTDPPIPETDLSLWFLDADASEWVAIAGSTVKPDDDIVVAEVMHTGQFGIFDAPIPDADQDVPGGGGGGGCAVLPVSPGGPSDPTLMALVGLAALYLVFRRRHLMRPAAAA